MNNYDIIIVGSGIGGLLCGATLSKEGLRVCVLEKHSVIGGCLQSFTRRGVSFDTGIHYVGSMDNGRFLNQYFKYCGILDKLKLRRLDNDAFEEIHAAGRVAHYGMGLENFRESMLSSFPDQKEAIGKYCATLKDIGGVIDVEHLKAGKIFSSGFDYMSISGSEFIESLTPDIHLRNALSGTVSLYGGQHGVTSLYHHAMINGSNLDGSYRFVDGTQQLADTLADEIRSNGGEVLTRMEVTKMNVTDGVITSVEVNNSELFFGKKIISNIHPVSTFRLVEKTPAIRKSYMTRIGSLANSYGMFTTYLALKPDSVEYVNRNVFSYGDKDPWDLPGNLAGKPAIFLSMQPSQTSPDYARVATILTPMNMSELAPWIDTRVGRRGEDYEQLKMEKAEQMIDMAAEIIPGLRSNIEHIYTASPLTYRDYTGIPEGSAYGIIKNCQNPLVTLFPVKTKIENLLLTGQNVNVHGLVGCGVTAALTCTEIIGTEYLAHKMGAV